MRYISSLFCILCFCYACDDGDIIITGFDFDETDLQLCIGSEENEFVFYKNNTDNEEAISYNFISDTYKTSQETDMPIVIDLVEDDNQLIYRKFNKAIDNNYYCTNIPDISITVTEELVSIAGTATINNVIIDRDDADTVDASEESTNDIDPIGDNDEDGVLNYHDAAINDPAITDIIETIDVGFDTDQDEIPNFTDQDDDNDNILTTGELSNGDPNDDSYLDTDDDGIPNYLDDDDDGDGILTRNEDIDGDGNPRNDDSDGDRIPNYLDNDDDDDGILTIDDPDTPMNEVDVKLSNTIRFIYRTTLNIENLEFDNENENFLEDSFSFGFFDVTISRTTNPN